MVGQLSQISGGVSGGGEKLNEVDSGLPGIKTSRVRERVDPFESDLP